VLRDDRYAALRAFTRLLAAAFLLALLVAACGGEGDDDTGEDPLQELNALADRATEGATAKVTYTVTTSINDETSESEQIVAQRPPHYRLEVSVPGDALWTRSVVINEGDRLFVCLGTESEGSCLDLEPSIDSAQEALAQTSLHVTVEHPLEVELFDTPQQATETTDDTVPLVSSQRQIAGLDATCFMQEVPNLETELCFSDQGLTLYWLYSEVAAGGVTRVFEATATSVSTDVTDEDFEPPYEIVEGSRFETTPP
jgi:hypothetical protein